MYSLSTSNEMHTATFAPFGHFFGVRLFPARTGATAFIASSPVAVIGTLGRFGIFCVCCAIAGVATIKRNPATAAHLILLSISKLPFSLDCLSNLQMNSAELQTYGCNSNLSVVTSFTAASE